MTRQIFEIWRAPEAEPIEAHEIRYWLWIKRQDTEWDVEEGQANWIQEGLFS